ncbi:MAG: endonuclease/exonuclease/phosphatase family protein [Caulobacter sp.]|nr:endonuclease/exonuclease/phosphatase family protein [Caulobacter sp.]
MTALLRALGFLVRLLGFALAGGAALAAALAQGGRVSDRLDVLTHFAPIWLSLGIAGLIVWVIGGGRSLLRLTPIAAAVAVLGSGALMLPELTRAKGEPAPAAGESLKLVQFNLWEDNSDPEASARWVLDEDPDIITIVEGYEITGGVARMLRARYPYAVTCADPQPCSTMILSKRPPIWKHGLSTAVSPAMLSAARARFAGAKGPFEVIAIHYTWPIPAGPQQQQGKRLLKVLQTVDRDNAIIGGDFNSTPWSFSLRRQDDAFGMERRTRGQATWPAAPITRYQIRPPFPLLAIDQVYAGKAWKTVSVKRGPRLGSDHYPIVVVLKR